jgi:serine/threonine protein kinase HipA of HipAB toxin-antitoxin module
MPLNLRLAHGHAVAVQRFDRAGALRMHALSARVARQAAEQERGHPELALLLRWRGEADEFLAQGERLFRRMVFNILIDNTDRCGSGATALPERQAGPGPSKRMKHAPTPARTRP